MAMSIASLYRNNGDDNFFTESFRNIIEDHLQYLRYHNTTQFASIELHTANKFKGDLTALLVSMNLTTDMHWIIMRMNGYTNPFQYDGETLEILIPDARTVKTLLQRYMQRKTIT